MGGELAGGSGFVPGTCARDGGPVAKPRQSGSTTVVAVVTRSERLWLRRWSTRGIAGLVLDAGVVVRDRRRASR